MSEFTRFHSMTKPLKFRRTRLLFNQIGSGIRDVTIYILYKLNIIKKYSYRDDVERVTEKTIRSGKVKCSFLSATVESTLVETEHIDEEWYYFKDRMRRVYVVRDEHIKFNKVVSHLVDLCIILGEQKYIVQNGLPVFKATYSTPTFKENVISSKALNKSVHENMVYKSLSIDIRKISSLEWCYQFYNDKEDNLVPSFIHLHDMAIKEFNDYLSRHSLVDYVIF